LGFVLNETLSATDHFAKVCQKVYWILRSLRPHSSRILILSLILPHFTCGSVVFAGPDAESREKLERAFRACIRFLHRLKHRDNVADLASTITGFEFQVYLRIRLLSFLYKILHIRHPNYIFSMFQFSSSQRSRGLVPPVRLRAVMDRSFIVKSVEAWNSLPYPLKLIETHNAFITALEKHFSPAPGRGH
jgi:hypothetical protein